MHTRILLSMRFQSHRAHLLLFIFFPICVFISKDSPGPSELHSQTQPMTINTSERHKSGLGMCHGNHFLFLLRAAPGVRRVLPLPPLIMFAHMNVCLWGTMIHRARPIGPFFLVSEKETSVEKEIRQMFTLPREELYSDPLEIGGGPQWHLYRVILPDYLCHLVFSFTRCAVARSARKRV